LRSFVFILLVMCSSSLLAQITDSENSFVRQLKSGSSLPEKLLATRTAVFYTYTFTPKELDLMQESFQRSGVDAVVYFETDYLFASKDASNALSDYLNQREITNLIFFQKKEEGYACYIVEYNTKPTLVEQSQYAWSSEDKHLSELLLKIYRTSANSLKKTNMLIIDVPETGVVINPILGRRSDFFAIDLKVDPIAIPKSGNEKEDKELEGIFAIYPFKYKLTEPGLSEKELRKQGYYYVLVLTKGRNKVLKQLLGYDMSKAETAHVSVTYPNGQPVLKSYDADESVFKYYIKHIDSQNVFLGTKWDADVTWQQALLNHLKAFKSELKLN
jgi:hypothetical protein